MGENNNFPKAKISIRNFDLFYGNFQALHSIDMDIPENKITAFIGPSGCGKSTLLKSLNRMNDLVENCKISGDVLLDGTSIYDGCDVNLLRKRVGMVFQKPNPFPMSIYNNIAYGPKTHGITKKADLDEIVEKSLREAAIWDEVKDRLNKSALGMSGGQQQRLCIARALAVNPEVLLMDEPTSALDPISTGKIEELCDQLRNDLTIVIVTHNMHQRQNGIFPAWKGCGIRRNRTDFFYSKKQKNGRIYYRPFRLIYSTYSKKTKFAVQNRRHP